MNAFHILKQFAEAFEKQIDEDFQCQVQCTLKDTGKTYIIHVENGSVAIEHESTEQADASFTTTTETLEKILQGKITGFTAASKAHVSDSAPLDWKLTTGYEPQEMERFYYFIMHFFNPTHPEKILLGEEYSRKVHGGHAIPLYYHPGFRSAWYMLKQGERLNAPGETDPFHQAVVIIRGEGTAKIGEKTVTVKAGESYYIPPHKDQVLWNEENEPLEFIWFAWGQGA